MPSAKAKYFIYACITGMLLFSHAMAFDENPMILPEEKVSVNWSTKLWFYLQRREFKYIASKLLPYWHDAAIYLLFILFIYVVLRVPMVKKWAFYCISCGFVFITLPTLPFMQTKSIVEDANPKQQLGPVFFIQQLKKDNVRYGNAIWAEVDKVSARYFIFNHCYNRYEQWKTLKKQTPLYACAASYVADMGVEAADGLTVENGKIINRDLNKNMDGLVTIDESGKIRIYDLKNEKVEVNGTLLDITDPFLRQFFIDWLERNKMSTFQTHLLVNNGQLKKGRTFNSEPAMRRLFAMVSEKQKNYFILFNISNYLTLTEATADVFNYITSYKKARIVKLINLDTGYYDAIQVINKEGGNLPEISGSRPIQEVANLFCIYSN